MKADLKKLKRTVTGYSRIFPASGRGTVRGKGFKMFECKEFLKINTEDPPTRKSGGTSPALCGWWIVQSSRCKSHVGRVAKTKSGVLWFKDGPKHAPLMLRVKVGSYIDHVNTVQFGKEFFMPSRDTTRLAAWTS